MSNNNTPPDDNDNEQLPDDVHAHVPDGLNDVDSARSGPSKQSIKMAGIAAGVVAVGGYVLYSIFTAPEPPSNLNPVKDQKGSGSVAQGGDIPPPPGEGGGALPQPPVVALQPPPPPIESPIYTPPPVIAPPPPPAAAMPPAVSINLPPPLPIPEPSAPPSPGNTSSPMSAGIDAPPPPPPPPAPEISQIGTSRISPGAPGKDDAAKQRLRANMMVMSGGATSGQEGGAEATFSDDGTVQPSGAPSAVATGITNLSMTIAQGKVVNAVLETAINTDLAGTLRAIVSRDVYAETGRNILIPKGSRLIGTYGAGASYGQSRIMIVWERLIRPDGIDIQIGSPATDGLGRMGMDGVVDNKFLEAFSAAIMTSALSLGMAVATDAVLPSEGGTGTTATTTTTPEGNQTTTISPAQQAAGSALLDFGKVAKDIVDKTVNVSPTITVDQGTLINVFVNQDLTFPSGAGGDVFVQ